MTYNLIKTIKVGTFLEIEEDQAPALVGEYQSHSKDHWHRWIERKPIQLMIVSLVVVAIGGLIEFVPVFLVKSNIPTIVSVKPYTPLELQGRDIYIRLPVSTVCPSRRRLASAPCKMANSPSSSAAAMAM